MLTRTKLFKLRLQAIRSGSWFSKLNGLERGIMDLSIRLLETVKSVMLLKELSKILDKLVKITHGRFMKKIISYGVSKAKKNAGIAMKWGSFYAKFWVSDYDYARYLTLMNLVL